MGKDVVIFIKGTRSIDGESDTVELMTKGRYYKKRNARYLYKLPDGTWRLAHGMCPDGWIEAYAP